MSDSTLLLEIVGASKSRMTVDCTLSLRREGAVTRLS